VTVHSGGKNGIGRLVQLDRWGGEDTLQGSVRLVEPAGFTKASALGVEEQQVRIIVDITSPPAQWRQLGDGWAVFITDAERPRRPIGIG